MGDIADVFDAMREHAREVKVQRRAVIEGKLLPQVQKYLKSHSNLALIPLTEYQYRVKNVDTRDFMDFWTTRCMMTIDKHYTGMGYKDERFWREIKTLAGNSV